MLLPRGTGIQLSIGVYLSSEFKLRWNTPEREALLCGHATLAAAAAIFIAEGNAAEELIFHTVYSGKLVVRRADPTSSFHFQMSLPLEATTSDVADFACPGGGLLKALLGNSEALVEEIRFCQRLKYLLVVLKSGSTRQELEALRPDFPALLAAVPDDQMRQALVTLSIVTLGNPTDSEHDFLSRCFAPWSGIPEDPVTGSAHGVMAPYWAQKLKRTSLVARQCSKRGGELKVIIDEASDRVKVLGNAAIVSKGELYL